MLRCDVDEDDSEKSDEKNEDDMKAKEKMTRRDHEVSRDVTIHNTEDCESRVLMIERSQK
jgi:hypothetical protein